jgi:hypothetical protein
MVGQIKSKAENILSAHVFFPDQFNNDDKKLTTRKFKELLLEIQYMTMQHKSNI